MKHWPVQDVLARPVEILRESMGFRAIAGRNFDIRLQTSRCTHHLAFSFQKRWRFWRPIVMKSVCSRLLDKASQLF